MKTKTQMAGRPPLSPQVNGTNRPITWEIPLGASLARQGAHLTPEERLTAVRIGVMQMTRPQPQEQAEARLKAEFEQATGALDCTFNTGFGGVGCASVAIGQNRGNECWEIVRCQYAVKVDAVSLPEALREMAKLHDASEDGYITSHHMDHAALSAMFTEAADTIEYAGQQLKAA